MEIIWAILILSCIGLVAGVGLTLASIFMGVQEDEKKLKIRDALPGANCGGCGYAGCDDYAEAILKGKAEAGLCSPGGVETANALCEILGTEITAQKYVAFVACSGNNNKAITKSLYNGLQSCAAANMLYSGNKACTFGCLGFGDCAAVCELGAIKVKNGVAAVTPELCKGCRKCEAACPKKIIKIIPESDCPKVACNSTIKGAAVRKVCTAGCIGCGLCQKQCEFSALQIIDNLAVINPDLCENCGKCASVCPQKCIVKY